MGFFEPPLSNNAAIVLLVGTLLAEQTEEWQVIRRHMNQECLVQVVGSDILTAQVLINDLQTA
ncbi:hypothetical protein ACSSZE_16840 [Acidithiobacillus caldus]